MIPAIGPTATYRSVRHNLGVGILSILICYTVIVTVLWTLLMGDEVNAPPGHGQVRNLVIALLVGLPLALLPAWRYLRASVSQSGHVLHVRNPWRTLSVDLRDCRGFFEKEVLHNAYIMLGQHDGPAIAVFALPFLEVAEGRFDFSGMTYLPHPRGLFQRR